MIEPKQQGSELDQALRSQRVIPLALATGVLAFSSVIAFLYLTGDQTEPATPEFHLLNILSIAHLALAVISWPLALFMKGPMQRAGLKATGTGEVRKTKDLLGGMLRGNLVQLALLEGSALFGLVTCLIGVLGGEIQVEPIYWLNAISAALFVLFVLFTLPTRENIEEGLRQLRRDLGH